MADVVNWAAWGPPLAWTIGTLAISWALGHLVGVVLMSRVAKWMSDRHRRLTEAKWYTKPRLFIATGGQLVLHST